MNPKLPKQWLFPLGLLLFYTGFCGYLFVQQSTFLFFPATAITETPANYQVKYEEVTIPIADDRLYGWWLPASGESALIYLHGNGANIGANSEHGSRLRKMGFSVLLMDYRGYGKSTGGFPTEQSVYADAEAMWQYLVQQRKIKPQNIFIYGHSLGGAVAIELALRHPEARALIVESSFTSTTEMAQRESWTQFFPVPLLLTQKFDSLTKVPQLQMPVLFIHGTADEVVPATMSEALYRAAPPAKSLFLVAGANHENDALTDPIGYRRAIQGLIESSR